jgi:hypothetical protein
MNHKADFAPIRWSYKKTREVARRMDGKYRSYTLPLHVLNLFFSAFRGELASHHPRFHPASPAAAKDIDIQTAKGILPNGFTVGIHMVSSIHKIFFHTSLTSNITGYLAHVCSSLYVIRGISHLL